MHSSLDVLGNSKNDSKHPSCWHEMAQLFLGVQLMHFWTGCWKIWRDAKKKQNAFNIACSNSGTTPVLSSAMLPSIRPLDVATLDKLGIPNNLASCTLVFRQYQCNQTVQTIATYSSTQKNKNRSRSQGLF